MDRVKTSSTRSRSAGRGSDGCCSRGGRRDAGQQGEGDQARGARPTRPLGCRLYGSGHYCAGRRDVAAAPRHDAVAGSGRSRRIDRALPSGDADLVRASRYCGQTVRTRRRLQADSPFLDRRTPCSPSLRRKGSGRGRCAPPPFEGRGRDEVDVAPLLSKEGAGTMSMLLPLLAKEGVRGRLLSAASINHVGIPMRVSICPFPGQRRSLHDRNIRTASE